MGSPHALRQSDLMASLDSGSAISNGRRPYFACAFVLPLRTPVVEASRVSIHAASKRIPTARGASEEALHQRAWECSRPSEREPRGWERSERVELAALRSNRGKRICTLLDWREDLGRDSVTSYPGCNRRSRRHCRRSKVSSSDAPVFYASLR